MSIHEVGTLLAQFNLHIFNFTAVKDSIRYPPFSQNVVHSYGYLCLSLIRKRLLQIPHYYHLSTFSHSEIDTVLNRHLQNSDDLCQIAYLPPRRWDSCFICGTFYPTNYFISKIILPTIVQNERSYAAKKFILLLLLVWNISKIPNNWYFATARNSKFLVLRQYFSHVCPPVR